MCMYAKYGYLSSMQRCCHHIISCAALYSRIKVAEDVGLDSSAPLHLYCISPLFLIGRFLQRSEYCTCAPLISTPRPICACSTCMYICMPTPACVRSHFFHSLQSEFAFSGFHVGLSSDATLLPKNESVLKGYISVRLFYHSFFLLYRLLFFL